ncbi:hypothetical protein K438DRAFT_1995368 [Mycena galopus ATCC 62051]|nr:hypothetical protein K438DRAFT_1995368 [Mycena galopus ATCC 62051]
MMEGDSLLPLHTDALRVAIVAELPPKIDGSNITLAHLLQHLHSTGIRAMLLGPGTGMASYAGPALLGLVAHASAALLSILPSPHTDAPRTHLIFVDDGPFGASLQPSASLLASPPYSPASSRAGPSANFCECEYYAAGRDALRFETSVAVLYAGLGGIVLRLFGGWTVAWLSLCLSRSHVCGSVFDADWAWARWSCVHIA